MGAFRVQFRDSAGWHSCSATHARGAAFSGDELWRSERLADEVGRTAGLAHFMRLISPLNGYFAAARQADDRTLLAAVDRTRSMPLFYATASGTFFLSDDAEWVQQQVGYAEPDELIAAEFLLAGYVTGRDTLNPRVKQLQAGEALEARLTEQGVELQTALYFRYVRQPGESLSQDDLLAMMDGALQEAVQRTMLVAAGRCIVLPLSSGLDSLRIAMMLRRLGARDLIAYSFGRQGNDDARGSRDAARRLDIPWLFVPYTASLWRRWYSSPECLEYRRYAMGLCSVPILQDWPAVRHLVSEGLVPRDALFVPGHSAEAFVGTTFMPPDWAPFFDDRLDVEGVIRAILDCHYNLWRGPLVAGVRAEQLADRIVESLGNVTSLSSSAALYETWAVSERQAKFITNAVRAYEHGGFEWWMPMWDNAYVDYWRAVPVRYRRQRKISNAYVSREYLKWAGPHACPAKRRSVETLLAEAASLGRKLSCKSRMLRSLYLFLDRELKYRTHPLAWYGIVPHHVYSRLFFPGVNINSFLALDCLGLLDSGRSAWEQADIGKRLLTSLVQRV
jgi:asparagine synthase (glutamine-hydrolysing)